MFLISFHYFCTLLSWGLVKDSTQLQGATYLQNYAVAYCQMLKRNLLLKEKNGCCHRPRFVKAYSEFKQRRF